MRAAFRFCVVVALVFSLAGCESKFRRYDGPKVTHVTVHKDARTMTLHNGDKALKSYKVDLGFAPEGDKKEEGDGKTPEGSYFVNRRNPRSKFHLSLGIDYPNKNDLAEAKARGVNPGGDIFIHGRGPWWPFRWKADWTWGCIAVTNSEMEEVYAMVRNGTPVHIYQ